MMKAIHTGIGMLICLMALGLALPAYAVISETDIPDSLAPWRSWVLHGHEDELCPSQYNNGTVVRCQWPARLNLYVSADGGRFEQSWLLFSKQWVPLPGSPEHWPDAVAINGRSMAVINRGNRPMVFLEPGEHHIVGRFFWQRLPEMIQVPPSLGLLSLTLEDRPVRSPQYDDQGRLWLRQGGAVSEGREMHRVQVFRLFSDSIPMQVTTVLKLDIAGPGRELVFRNMLMTNGVAMHVESRLPARMDGLGQLVVQARAGQWEIRVQCRLPGPILKIDAGPKPYDNEIWSFRPQHHLRMVELEGLPELEPSRTEMPPGWHRWSAYQVSPNAVLSIKEIRRGDPDPAPDRLYLHRIWWLDFDGGGFTIHDRLSGTLNRQWSLAMNAPMIVGRVAVDGEDQVITRQGSQGKTGVELRRGRLDLHADSRLPTRENQIPALGWDHDVQEASAVLNLPPGWRLIGATGMDQISDSWLQRWSLLDFFLVLIIALAVFKLRSWTWGLVALVAMILIFHEPDAPRLVWLHVLAVIALLPLLPVGWIRRLVMLWGLGAGVVLVVISIPFIVNQIRWAVYPQLAPAYSHAPAIDGGFAKTAVRSVPVQAPQPKPSRKAVPMKSAAVASMDEREAAAPLPEMGSYARQSDPNALIPTGPGLPDWQWQSVALNWTGPVSKDQHIRFYLLSPTLNFFVCLLRVGLMVALLMGLLDWRPWWRKIMSHINPVSALLVAALVFVSADGVRAAEAERATGFPPPALLEAFKQRLLEKPDCLPYCADISRMEMTVSEEQLQILLKIHAARPTAVPLPVNNQSWTPDQILLDNAPIGGLSRDGNGQLWALVSGGLHTVVILGDIGHLGVIQIPFMLKPHLSSFSTPGWDLKGIRSDGRIGASIQLIRLQKTDASSDGDNDGPALPAFLSVKRQLRLGLTWRLITTVSRMTPLGAPIVVSIPLLDQESVITEGLPTAHGDVLVSLSADQRVLTYQSTLDVRPTIQLKAPRSVPWTETWALDASPVWHCDLEGIAVIHHQDGTGTWQPQWKPWPGEQVTIRVHRPQAVSGQEITIDRADLLYIPGQRFARGELSLRMRTSRGEQYTMELPPKANLQQTTVDGKSLPIRQDGPYVTIPLQPGAQAIKLQWHQPAPLTAWLKTPALKIGHSAVNARISVQIPANRWVLMVGGPRWGPAVLFWSYLVVILLVAAALGRISLSPLKPWSWILLGLGLTQIAPLMALVIVGWLWVLALRKQRPMPTHWLAHNALQVGLIFWTLAALVCLFAAVKAGLVGQPAMQIQGNQSYSMLLNWTQDRIAEHMPQPWVFSLPVWTYRVLMLAWSLWLAWALLRWLKWGWQCFSCNGAWRKKLGRRSKDASEDALTPDTANADLHS